MKPSLPNKDDLAKIPRWARVALAVRCARRVTPLLRRSWPEASAQHVTLLNQALNFAEGIPSGSSSQKTSEIEASASKSGSALRGIASRANSEDCSPAAEVALAVSYACFAALAALRNAPATDATEMAISSAAKALMSARDSKDFARTGVSVVNADVEDLIAHIGNDFDRLLKQKGAEKWQDSTRVKAEMFGPLWPSASPKWFSAPVIMPPEVEPAPAKATQPSQTRKGQFFDLWIDAGHASVEDIAELFSAMSDLQKVLGGKGLVFNREESKDFVLDLA
jgi:hypothetical protein